MDAQMATYFVTMQPHDLIAGRISRPYVVFAQCMEGDGIDKTGYCIDVANCEKELKRMKADDSYSEEDCMQAEEMIQFWKTENTNTKIRQQFPKSWAGSMGGDDYVHDNAAIHPLYRLAGVNLDFKKLFRLGVCGLRDEALRLAQETQDSEKKNFYEGVASVQESLRRVMDALEAGDSVSIGGKTYTIGSSKAEVEAEYDKQVTVAGNKVTINGKEITIVADYGADEAADKAGGK